MTDPIKWEQQGLEYSYEQIGPQRYVTKVKDGFLQAAGVQERGFCSVVINGETVEGEALIIDGRNDLDYLAGELRQELRRLGIVADENPRKTLEEWMAEEILPTFAEENLVIELLRQVLILRNEPALQGHLWPIWNAMNLYANYRIVAINALAKSGVAAKKARSEGPKARTSKLGKIRNIVWSHTADFWRDHPHYESDSSNTARCIGQKVNLLLRAAGLLTKDRAEKTLADDIRAGLSSGFFQIGQSGAANGQS